MITRYKNIFENSNEGLLVVNSAGIIETVNPKLLEMFGYTKNSNLEGQKLEILIPQKIKKKHVALRDSYISSPGSRPMGLGKKLSGLRKDGTEFPVEISLSYFKEGGELKVNAFIIDITKRVAIENEILKLNEELEQKVEERTIELNDQNNLLKSIAENFPNGNIYVINNDYIIEWADGSVLRTLGLTDKSLVGVSFEKRLPVDIKERVSKHLNLLFKGEKIKFELEDKGEHYLIYGVGLSEINGEVKKALLVEMDITKEKQNELKMEANLNKERELNELKSRFVSMASHEFRTPLSTIDSSATLISRYESDAFKEKRNNHVDRIKRMVSNLTIILNDFLSLEKLESGKINYLSTEVDLIVILKQSIDELNELRKGNKEVNLVSNESMVVVTTDSNIIKNCILNLLSNALKYTRDNGVISVRIEKGETHTKISIVDNGIGIPKQDQDRLFSRFHRAGNVTNIEGTGLGLNIVKRYLEGMNGAISFNSTENVGSEFVIEIPNTFNVE